VSTSANRLHACLTALGYAVLIACASKPAINDFAPTRPQQTAQPTEAAKYNVQLGVAYMERGELAVAKEKLERAVKQNPHDPNAHSALAMLYERLGDPSQADAQFQTALRLAPHSPEISNNYAVYLCRTHRVDEGVRRLLEAARNPLYPTPEAAYTNAGVCLRGVHRDDEAERAFVSAVTLRPGFAEAVYQLSDLDMQHGRLVQARARIDSYIANYTATPELLLLGVHVAHALGDRPSELRYAQRLRVDFPDSQQTRSLLAPNPNPG